MEEDLVTVRWGNDDKSALYVAPLSVVALVFGTALFVYAFFAVLVEESSELFKKAFLLCFFPWLAYWWFRLARGGSLMVLEFLTKFIVHTGRVKGEDVRLTGFYFRRAHFTLADVASVEPLEFDRFRWSNLTEDATNYIVTLKDGRRFFLSGWLDDADGFARALGLAS